MFLYELLPFNADKHIHFHSFQTLYLKQVVNFLFAIELYSDFLQGSNIYKLKENRTRHSLSFPLLLHGTGTIFPVIREITPMRNVNKKLQNVVRIKIRNVEMSYLLQEAHKKITFLLSLSSFLQEGQSWQ
jgi:hypothetical protein